MTTMPVRTSHTSNSRGYSLSVHWEDGVKLTFVIRQRGPRAVFTAPQGEEVAFAAWLKTKQREIHNLLANLYVSPPNKQLVNMSGKMYPSWGAFIKAAKKTYGYNA